MSNEILMIQPDSLKDFDLLWDNCKGGPDASVRGFQRSSSIIAVPRSPRRLSREDFHGWLLP